MWRGLGYCGRRTFGFHFTDNRTAVYPGFVFCAVVPADSQCSHKRGAGACRRVYDGFDLQNRHGGYVGSTTGFYHHHYDDPHLLHCRRDGVGTALLCIGKTVLRQAQGYQHYHVYTGSLVYTEVHLCVKAIFRDIKRRCSKSLFCYTSFTLYILCIYYQITTRSAGNMYIGSPSLISNAE